MKVSFVSIFAGDEKKLLVLVRLSLGQVDLESLDQTKKAVPQICLVLGGGGELG